MPKYTLLFWKITKIAGCWGRP